MYQAKGCRWCWGFVAGCLLGLMLWPSVLPAADSPAQKPVELTEAQRARAVETLRRQMAEGTLSEKAEAAECLLATDHPQGVVEAFKAELDQRADTPGERVAIWRVLARAVVAEADQKVWIKKLRDAALDVDAPDRVEAISALAELRYEVKPEDRRSIEKAVQSLDGRLSAAGFRLLTASGDAAEADVWHMIALLDGAPEDQALAAEALCRLKRIPPDQADEVKQLLTDAIQDAPPDSEARVRLVSAAALLAGPGPERNSHLDEIRRHATEGRPDQRHQALRALALLAAPDDVALLTGRLDDPAERADVKAVAAWALLRLERRRSGGLHALDWVVLALYVAGLLAIGWYFARRTKTTDDYLLGGRNMNPLTVGLSLFATMLSTITYLAYPGEMIRYGPIFFASILAYPLVYPIAGYLLIPTITKLRVTSAYEILERRLGLSVRMLGSTFFLLMRLFWMAVIIYATTDKVLIPMLGLPSSAAPLLCAVLGVITLIYTSMGGLRAVVLTDVTQSVILFGGAMLTIILATVSLGGVGQWAPTHWYAHWPKPTWTFDPSARVTFLSAILAHFFWWTCTAGSDQMAIQRYLATRDVKTARRVLATSLIANVGVALLLMAVGLTLLAFFRANPQFLPDGKTILGDSDQLFAQFIVRRMPVGVSGLVIAGLLAAAMSSLSSGVNSSCSVLTVDFVDRFRRNRESELDHIKLAKYISVLVGVVVVGLSASVGLVEGNLLELAFKVVNLLTVPLFGLFFMAIFIRWATGPGTLIGAAAGVATVVFINYSEELTGTRFIGIFWAMPVGLIVQVSVGMVASLLPLGRRGPFWDELNDAPAP
ncbi:MAG: sodium:solute symporter [Pirellulales bacterium]|nr:sodium:solute symporter [Pirellulales bacterium]